MEENKVSSEVQIKKVIDVVNDLTKTDSNGQIIPPDQLFQRSGKGTDRDPNSLPPFTPKEDK